MRKQIISLLILVCSISAQAQVRGVRRTPPLAGPALTSNGKPANSLPIRRVILYSNGVAYVERRGFVTGNAEVDLPFKQSQVDDVLKSMVVLDLGQGKIGAVSYNSSAPISSRMAEIPFSVNPVSGDGGGISSVLSQLQGAKVIVSSTKGTATGSILTIERKQIKTEKEVQITSVLVIASDSGEISSFDLADVRSVKLLDEGTRKDINEFANATASTRRLDAKTITVTSTGTGQREMVVSYTIAAPIWKTTYRVVLDADGKPFFQGWAIVDNVSDEDWSGVQMSLVSGSPISFIQNLQKPFYRYRPVVPIPSDLQLEPQIYEPQSGIGTGSGSGSGTGGTSIGTNVTNAQIGNLPKSGQFTSSLKVVPGVRPEALAGGFTVDGASGTENTFVIDGQEVTNFRSAGLNSNNSMVLSTTKVSDALTGPNSGVSAVASGEEVGDLFEYRIEQPVTVEKNRSALIPIVQTKMDGERVSIYNESARRDRPFSGVLLKNMTNLTLESGSLTVIDGNAYAGEALMERLKPKEQRLISFALDLGTHVRVRQTGDREPAKLVKAVNGVLQVHYFRAEQKTYDISNQTDRPKVLYIEYLKRDDWELSEDTPKPDYVTQKYYRFRVELAPLEEKQLKLSVRQPLMDTYQLSSLSKTDLSLFVTRRYIDEATRARLEKLIDLRTKLAEIDNKLESFDDEVEKIEADQKRLRENIEALSKTAEAKALIARYIAKAGEQETRLEEMEKERRDLAGQKEQLTRELATEIRAFEIK
ncbi:MAG TPA: hypothetical protein PLP07_08355 [Pyrinomonadaceae bacterium]|nr:hypothetical protein [Chloracidobacterium sp.]MBP9934595.1 hypothetical protein [Pyrinomonadaceae bacterium]MBK9438501.1 hypothetical protein [Chloracidobacterium sp.]MBL0240619.1 hypothetical protein [Chloracidobacterium sp.]HQX55923.1 hypothetical protein [Pyrinomonadaceae bacterium]